MRVKLIVFLALTFSTLFGFTPQLSAQRVCKLKGVVYKNITDIGGLEDFVVDEASILVDSFSFSHCYCNTKGKHIIILEKCLINKTTGNAKFQILDTLNVTVENSKLCVATQCNDSTSARFIVALMNNGSDPKKKYKLIKAWQLDLYSETIKPISTKGIICTTPDQLGESGE